MSVHVRAYARATPPLCQVLSSTGMRTEGADAPVVPEIDSFPEENGLREHMHLCMDIFHQLQQSPRVVRPDGDAN